LKPRVAFVAKFAVGMIALYLLTAWNPVNDRVIVPFTEVVAHASALPLQGVWVVGTVMRSPRFALDVQNGCNGVEAAILLAAAILAFPATLRSRAIGLLAGVVAIQLLNVVRLSSLFWLGEHYRQVFDLFHVGVWQSLVILAAISFFVLWSVKFAEIPLARTR
jgi:exosortase H (IPTLxxWG-CTERM-specific)